MQFAALFRPAVGRLAVIGCALLAVAAVAPAQERIYLTDTDGVVTDLCTVEFDAVTGVARLERITTVDSLGKVDALACTPDGTRAVLIDKYDPVVYPPGGTMAVYEFASGTLEVVGDVVDADTGALVEGIVLAAFRPGPGNRLLVASQTTESLYTVDLATAVATRLGPIVVQGTASALDLNGADLAFTADARLFLWTNSENLPDAPRGLYEVFLPDTQPGTAEAIHLGNGLNGEDPATHFFTGLAVRDGGRGDLVGCNRFDEIHQHDRDGNDVELYMMELDGGQPIHRSGDMCNGEFACFVGCELSSEVVMQGGRLGLEVRVIHNRPNTVTTRVGVAVLDEGGARLVATRTDPVVFDWGDDRTFHWSVRVPPTMPLGDYAIGVRVLMTEDGGPPHVAALCPFTVVPDP